jgi:pimeloyl-ACP methyl ester carboxylesterase
MNRPTAPVKSRSTTPQEKPILVMIHGFRGTHHGLLLIAKKLQGYSIVIPDLPGFGRGATLKEYNLENYVKWLEAFIAKHSQGRQVILLGHSFGSIICAAYAKEHPETIKKMVLVNPIGAPALDGPKKVLTKLAIIYYKLGAQFPETLAHKWLSAKPIVRIMSVTMAKTHDKGLRTYIHHQHDEYFSLFHSPQSVLEGFKTSVSHNVGDFAKKITVPTLLIAGSLDDITPLSDQYSLVKKFPDANLKVISNVGHLTHYETPDKVADFVQRFTNPL